MQFVSEHSPKRGGSKSCPTYRAAEQDEKASDGLKHDLLRQRNDPGPELVQIPIQENEKQIEHDMGTTGRIRAQLGRYEDSAKIILKPNTLLRTKVDEYSINFARNSTRITPRRNLHSKEHKSEKEPPLDSAGGRNRPIAFD